jgi:hypothetical protein
MWVELLLCDFLGFFLALEICARWTKKKTPASTDVIEAFISTGWQSVAAQAPAHTQRGLLAAAVAQTPPTPAQVHWAPELRRSAHHRDRFDRYKALWNQVFVWCGSAETDRRLTSIEACTVRAALWGHVAQVLTLAEAEAAQSAA